MNRALLNLFRPRRRLSLGRVVGVGAWLTVAFWSVVVLAAVGAYRSPGFLGRLGDAGGVGEAVGLLLGVVPASLLPLVVAGVALVVVPLRLVREVRRAYGRGRWGSRHRDYGRGYGDGHNDGPPGDLLGGGLVGGGLLGGVLAGAVDDFDGRDDHDGSGGGDE
jgi:hypothetical protein